MVLGGRKVDFMSSEVPWDLLGISSCVASAPVSQPGPSSAPLAPTVPTAPPVPTKCLSNSAKIIVNAAGEDNKKQSQTSSSGSIFDVFSIMEELLDLKSSDGMLCIMHCLFFSKLNCNYVVVSLLSQISLLKINPTRLMTISMKGDQPP